ncbi:hypothetical protein EKO27_g4561 [Xylaria grammica]|uniref:Uncharacterized protein n=1 Tax=Xylaria grammica TaxID=363999 RepID=A0A439D805_9PEZI|nr:hypothetical protein EKO27_g4561 [Xylaria grammica]
MSQCIDKLERVTVRIPDMFVSFLADPPRFNPNYNQVKAKSEAWISDFCSFDQRMSALIRKCDFSYFLAIAAPEAGPQEYRALCDWGNWGSSNGVQRRFSQAMADYCAGALMQVEDFSAHKAPPTPEEMLKMRRLSAGVSPLFSLVEYAHALQIPDYVFEHPTIQEIDQLGIDFVVM